MTKSLKLTSDVAQAARAAPPRLVRIEPSVGWVSIGFRELWEHRELFYFFVWRDVKVR